MPSTAHVREDSHQVIYQVDHLQWQAGSQTVLEDLSFTVSKGQRVGIIGANGAGKTSLLRCLSGLHAPNQGTIQLFNKPIQTYRKKQFAQQVAVVSQLLPEQFDASVWDFVSLGVMPHKSLFESVTSGDKARIATALKQTGLQNLASHSWLALSGGEKQRAFIARALVQQASVLLLDEPSNHLDIAFQLQLFRLLQNLPLTVVMSLHDLNLASSVCDHLLLLHNGKLVAQGAPKDVITTENLSRCFEVTCEVNLSHTGKPRVQLDYEQLLSQHE